MSTTSTTFSDIKGQQPTIALSPEQDPSRLHASQELLHQLQRLLTEGEAPSLDLLSDGLLKAEQFTLQAANQPNMDPQTRKTLEDINALLVSSRQLGRNKQIADRLQKISEEAQKALKEVRGPNVTAAAKEANENIQKFTNNWRPLFYLLMSSRDFRQLILDANRIARRVIYSYTEDVKDETSLSQKFVEGAPTQELANTVKEKVKEKGAPELSDEEWNTLQDDVQRVLALLAKEPTYRDGIERIFTLLDMFQKNLTQEPLEAAVPHDMHMQRIVGETEDLVACFSGRESLECFKSHLRQLILQIQKNENLQSYLNELKEFILKAKSETEVRSEEFKTRSKELARRGRELMRELKDQTDLDPFLRSTEEMTENIKNDEFLQVLRQNAGVVQSDLSYMDSQGQLQVDTDMLSKLQSALTPLLVDALKYIPVPKIYSNDYHREFWLDKIVLCSYDIIPQNIKFHLEADSEISLPDIETKGTHTYLVIKLDKLLTELKDMEFYYRKKTFPHLEDHGRVTFRITGKGAKLTFTYKLNQGPQDTMPRITEGYASFDISEMSIDFDKSTLKHPHMVPMITQMFKTQIRMEIERQVEQNLMGFLQKLGDQMTNSLKQINRPFHYGLEAAKKAVKSSQLAQVYEKRREKLE